MSGVVVVVVVLSVGSSVGTSILHAITIDFFLRSTRNPYDLTRSFTCLIHFDGLIFFFRSFKSFNCPALNY